LCHGYFWVVQVEIPKGAYSGQKLTKLVSVKTMASTSNTIPIVPLTVSVKNKVAKTAASRRRMILSVVPMFAFIVASSLNYNANM
jgi:hypothetical protein